MPEGKERIHARGARRMPESSGFGQILNSGNARIVQFGLKFYF